jgi:hypothetical protein
MLFEGVAGACCVHVKHQSESDASPRGGAERAVRPRVHRTRNQGLLRGRPGRKAGPGPNSWNYSGETERRLADPGWAGALAQDLSLPHAGRIFGQRRHLLASLPRDKSGGAKISR